MVKASTAVLLSALSASACLAQVVTPRGRFAAIYAEPNPISRIMAEVEPNGRWHLEFSEAEVEARLPEETADLLFTFLLPARDTGRALIARVYVPGKKARGWVEAEKVDVSPAPFWKMPANTPLFAPMRARDLPPLRAATLPEGLKNRLCSYLLLVDPEGKVTRLHPLQDATDPALEAALQQFRFAPTVFEGERTYVLLAIRAEPRPHAGR